VSMHEAARRAVEKIGRDGAAAEGDGALPDRAAAHMSAEGEAP